MQSRVRVDVVNRLLASESPSDLEGTRVPRKPVDSVNECLAIRLIEGACYTELSRVRYSCLVLAHVVMRKLVRVHPKGAAARADVVDQDRRVTS